MNVRPYWETHLDSAIDALLRAICNGFRPLVGAVANTFQRRT